MCHGVCHGVWARPVRRRERRQRNASGAQERSPFRASRHTPVRGSARHTLRRRVTVAAFRRVACATKMNCDIIFTYLSIRK